MPVIEIAVLSSRVDPGHQYRVVMTNIARESLVIKILFLSLTNHTVYDNLYMW